MEIERRTVLQAGGLVAVGGLVAACGSSGEAAASSSAPAAESSGAAFWRLFESCFGSAVLNEPVEPLPKKTDASDVVRSSQSAR